MTTTMYIAARAAFTDDQRAALGRIMPLLAAETRDVGDERSQRALNLLKAAAECRQDMADLSPLHDPAVSFGLEDLMAVRALVASAEWYWVSQRAHREAVSAFGNRPTWAALAAQARQYSQMLAEFRREVIDPTVTHLTYGRLTDVCVQQVGA